MAKQQNPVVILIENIKKDRKLLTEKSDALEKVKSERNEITSRIKEYRKDVAHMWKYMSEEQQLEIEELGLNGSESSGGGRGKLNEVSEIVVDLLMNAKDHQLTNDVLHSRYIDKIPKKNEALTYTDFNIKIRQLFNNGRISKEQVGSKASRDDIITLHVETKNDN